MLLKQIKVIFGEGNKTAESDRGKERIRRVIITAGSSFFHKFITTITGLVSIPLTIEYLGVERFGLWMTITSVLALIAFADLGLGNGLVNAIAKSNDKYGNTHAKKAVSSVFFMLLSVAFFLGALFVFIYPYLQWEKVFNLTSKIAMDEAGSTLLILLVIFIVNLPLSIIQKIQIGYQSGYKNNLWLSLGSILGLIGVLIAIYLKLGLPYLAGFMVIGPLVAIILNGVCLFKKYPFLFPRVKNFDFLTSKRLFKIGGIFLFLQLFTIIGSSFDNIIIAQVLGASEVASYAITKKMFLAAQISQFFIAPLWPAFIESMKNNDYIWAKKTLIRIITASMLMSALTMLPLVLWGQNIIEAWAGQQVVPTMTLLIGFYLFSIFQSYGGSVSVFLNNDALIKKQLVFVAMTNIAAVIFQVLLCFYIGKSGIIFGLLTGALFFYVIPSYKLSFGFLNSNIMKLEEKLR